MAKGETDIVHRIMLALNDGVNCALWKNVRGKFRPIAGNDKRVIAAGLSAEGSSDLIGLRVITVTPDMVGDRVAIFTAIEVKAGTSARPEQRDFIAKIKRYGGFAGVAHSVEEAREIILR